MAHEDKARRASGYKLAVISSFDTPENHDCYQISRAHHYMESFMKPCIADLIVRDTRARYVSMSLGEVPPVHNKV